MKRINIIITIAAFAGALSSCEEKSESPDFGVTHSITKIKVLNSSGTAEIDAYQVKFLFSGNAGNITFYSGESGKEYPFRNRYFQPVTSTKVQVTTAYGNTGNISNTLRVMASNDFEPEYVYNNAATITSTAYTAAGIEAAMWTDITDRFDLPGNRLGGAIASGEADITEFVHHDRPLFIAFRFEADKTSDELLRIGQWEFSTFQIRNYLADETSPYYINNVLDNNWKKVDLADTTSFTVAANRIGLNGNIVKTTGGVEIPTVKVQTMVISRPYYPTHIAADKGLVLKTLQENLSEYTYIYVDPKQESFKATFIATNSLYGEDRREVKEVEVICR